MAAAVYSTDLSNIIEDMASTTGWTALGGGASGLVAPETDFFIQGSNCISKAGWSTAVKGMIYNNGAGVTIPSNGAALIWIYYWAPNSLDTSSSGGLRAIVGSGTGAYYEYTVGGSDTLPFGGWLLAAVDPGVATADFTTGSPTSTRQYFGSTADVPAGGPSKGQPLGIDAIRYGRCTLTYTNGDLANGYATFAGAQSYGDATTRRWGLLSLKDGAYFLSGFHSLGSSGTSVDFRDSDKIIFIRDHTKVASAFNRIEVLNASSNVDWDNIQITALGTNSRGTFVHTAGSFDAVNCQFTNLGTFTFISGSVISNTIFKSCDQITLPGSSFLSNKVTGYIGSSNTSAVVWNVATDPNGKLDGTTFTKGSGTTHAIEFGTSSPTTMTLTNVYFSGYNGTDGQNDSAIHIKRTTGTVTINITGGTTPSYKSDGATVVLVSGTVTVSVNVKNATTGANIQSARVFLKADTGGPFPYQATVTITRSGSTATVSHTSHGLATNDQVFIEGAAQAEYNGVFSITKIDNNSYSYTVSGTPATPATGTIKSTFVFLHGSTDSNGNISMSRVVPSSQPVKGNVRKGTSSPLYKPAGILGTVSSSTGLANNIQLIPDE